MTAPPGDIHDLVQRGYRFAHSLTHNADQAEELLQEAWFQILRRGGPWHRGYLFATIRNRFIDQYRRMELLRPLPLNGELDGQVVDEGDRFVFPDGPMSLANGVAGALSKLGPEERAVLFLAAVEGMTAQAIADLLEWPRGTVLSMIFRARKKLQRGAQSEVRTAT